MIEFFPQTCGHPVLCNVVMFMECKQVTKNRQCFVKQSGMVWYGIVEFNVPLDTV